MDNITALRKRLYSLGVKYPELSGLIKKIPSDCSITKEWLSEYYSLNVEPRRRSLVLRVLLEDNSLGGRGNVSISPSLYLRISQYIIHHPKGPFSEGGESFIREDVPSHLYRHINIPRGSPHDFMVAYGLLPYLRFIRGESLAYIFGEEDHDSDLGYLEPFYKNYLITREVSLQMIRGKVPAHATRHYFEVQDDTVALRNIIMYLSVFWDQDREGGRLQNKLPVQVTRFLGVSRLSIPEIALVYDLIGMVVKQVIDLDCVSNSGVGSIVKKIHLALAVGGVHDLREIARASSKVNLLDGQKANELFGLKKLGLKSGTYDTSRYFNITRLLDRKQGERFRGVYEAIDQEKLIKVILEHFTEVEPDFLPVLTAALHNHPDEFSGVRARDLSNILFYVWHHDKQGLQAHEVLPSVATFALGAPEPRYTGLGHRSSEKKRKKVAATIKLPLLDELLRSESKAYVLYPNYLGKLPSDGIIYFPRSLARGYKALPDNLTLVGKEELAWGESPYDIEKLPEIAREKNIVHLK